MESSVVPCLTVRSPSIGTPRGSVTMFPYPVKYWSHVSVGCYKQAETAILHGRARRGQNTLHTRANYVCMHSMFLLAMMVTCNRLSAFVEHCIYWRSTQDTDRDRYSLKQWSKTKDQSDKRSHLVIRISLTVGRLYTHNPIQSLSSDWSINDSNIYIDAHIK